MPATTPKRIHFNDDSFAWLMALTHPVELHVNATLQEYVANEVRRDMNKKIEFMQNKQ